MFALQQIVLLVFTDGKNMKSNSPAVLTTITLIMFLPGCGSSSAGATLGSRFTGETLTLLYVTDVRRSVTFYEAVGFDLDYYYDYQTNVCN